MSVRWRTQVGVKLLVELWDYAYSLHCHLYLPLQRTMRFKWSFSRRSPSGFQEITKSLTANANTMVPATAKTKYQRPMVTCIDNPRAARIAPATTPVAPMVDSKQKQRASLRSSADAELLLRRRMAMSRTKLCASSSAERLRATCHSGMAGAKYGQTSQLAGARIAITSTSIQSARVIVASREENRW